MSMKTTDRDGFLWILTSKGIEIPCVRICGAVAWGDSTSSDETARNHAMIIGGEHKDGSLQVFDAFTGPWLKLIDKMIEAKDEAWALQWWVDPSAEGMFRELYRVDGLTFFAEFFPPDGLSKNHKAKISPWWQTFTEDLEGSRTMVDKLRQQRIAKVDQRSAVFRKAFEASKPDQIRTATSLATIALIWHMWQTSGARRGKRHEMPTRWPWYR